MPSPADGSAVCIRKELIGWTMQSLLKPDSSQAKEYKDVSFLMIYDNGTLKWVQLQTTSPLFRTE